MQGRSSRADRLGPRWIAIAVVFSLLFTVPATASATKSSPRGDDQTLSPSGKGVVSLTFDDGNAEQLRAGKLLAAFGLHSTFYVTSSWIGQPGYLGWDELRRLESMGHEIGGHTAGHPSLPDLGREEQTREICWGRNRLLKEGLTVRNFAYPFAAWDQTSSEAAERCGYNSARGLGDVASQQGCAGCVKSETVPPENPFHTRAPSMVDASWTLEDLKNQVHQAERSGGWTQLTFHHVCFDEEPCAAPSIDERTFRSFVVWLAVRQFFVPLFQGLFASVRTVGDVVGGALRPAVDPPSSPLAEPGVNALRNPGLEEEGTSSEATCWAQQGFGRNDATYSVVPGRNGGRAIKVSVSGYEDGDARVMPTLDLGECAPSALAGRQYELSAWYVSTVPVQIAAYYRDADYRWRYWTTSPWSGAGSEYAQIAWTTPALPEGASAISFGISLSQNGEVTGDDYSLVAVPTSGGHG